MSTKPSNNTEIEVRGCLTKPKKSKYYQAVLTFYDENGKQFDRQSISTKQTVKSNAMRAMMDLIDEKRQGCLCLSPHTLFADFMKHWVEEVIADEVEETTYNGYLMNVNNHIIPYFKPLKLRMMDLTPKVIQTFLDDKCGKKYKKTGKPLSPNSVKRFLSNLKMALDYAMQQECIEYNPARMCKVKREKSPFVALYYTFEQLIELCKACVDSPVAHLIMLAVFYGLRRGELLGLKWKHVDFSNNTFRVCETITRAKKELKKGVKNVSSDRTMPMILGFADYLKSLKKSQQETARFFGKEWTDENYVLSDEAGERFKMGRLNNCFKKVIKAAGLHDVRLHDLRHSNATFLLEYGISIEEVSAWLGHSSISITEKTYAHVHIGIRKRTAQSLDAMMGFDNQQVKKADLSIEDTLKMLFAALENRNQNGVEKQDEIENPFEMSFEPGMKSDTGSGKNRMGKVIPFKSSNG